MAAGFAAGRRFQHRYRARGTVRSVIELLADRCGGRDLLRIGALEPPAGEPAMLVTDMGKVQTRLGWSASTSVDAGLAQVLRGV
jgi:nucleoside-diphosphate-sugar epimerase